MVDIKQFSIVAGPTAVLIPQQRCLVLSFRVP